DDRGIYRPGDEVHVKGWLRRLGRKGEAPLQDVRGLVDRVTYTLTDERGTVLGRGQARVSRTGGFHVSVPLSRDASLGSARLALVARGAREVGAHEHPVRIGAYRAARLEASVRASPGPHLVGEPLALTAEARYYTGGGLAGAEVSWLVDSEPSSFTPPGRERFAFGAWDAWWMPADHARSAKADARQTWKARLDVQGRHVLDVALAAAEPPWPMRLEAAVQVGDIDRDVQGAIEHVLVHPAALYVGLASPAPFVRSGDALAIQAICVDHDGKAVAGRPLALRAERMEWSSEKDETIAVEAQACAVTSAADAVSCAFEARDSGLYRVTARVVDDQGRPSESQLGVWVAGDLGSRQRQVELQDALVIPDRRSYRPGDTARILVQSPFVPAEGVLTLRGVGIQEARAFSMREPSITLEVPVTDAFVPDMELHVNLVGAEPRVDGQGKPRAELPPRPALASGEVKIEASPQAHALTVTATPRDAVVGPGDRTAIDVQVRDAAGRPVRDAELAVFAVDEAVLALTGYRLRDPMDVFYASRWLESYDHHLREHVWLARLGADPRDLDRLRDVTGYGYGTGGGMGGGRLGMSAGMPFPVRDDFRAVAVFAPEVRTDAAGRARVPVTLPDNLTRYRVMAVAAAGTHAFGKAESSITTRKRLMVQPSPPRFLHAGDVFELPVMLHNQSDAPVRVEAAVRAHGVRFTEGSGRAISVPAQGRVEVRFPAVAETAGSARFQIAAMHAAASDATEIAVPVWSPVEIESFATYGTIGDAGGDGGDGGDGGGRSDGAVRQPVAVPAGARPDVGELSITTSSTQLQSLTDAVMYLIAYPYECSEQIASRILALAALRDVLPAFQGLPPATEIEASVRRDLQTLADRQGMSGGFALWDDPGADEHPFTSVHVAHALARARAAGYPVPGYVFDQARGYLRRIEDEVPAHYHASLHDTLLAYALHVRGVMGDPDPERARRFVAKVDLGELPLEAAGWLYGAMAGQSSLQAERATVHRYLAGHVVESAGSAHFAGRHPEGAHWILAAARRADAVILDALLADGAEADLVPRLVRGLLAARVRGRWPSTQDNVFALLALARYARTHERDVPAFLARVWLGDRFAGEHRFQGRSTAQHRVEIPMPALARGSAAGTASGASAEVVLQKTGPGRLYYRIGLRHAPASADVAALDQGFLVERGYEAVDDPQDVVRLADGTWRIRGGARVRVRLRMLAHAERHNVALVDRLPAGLEPVDPTLAATAPIPGDPAEDRSLSWWRRTWYEHQSLHDERVEAFTSLLPAGVHAYSYVARATTPGRFVAPPARAEEMYDPDTFGRSATTRVIVE
ncbi:MAG TPA: alpha-2-macroglobulin family protein, partial [Haliangium sp.]|nr:alpha-2-macroglobulin family protein [Haliangium sp.]